VVDELNEVPQTEHERRVAELEDGDNEHEGPMGKPEPRSGNTGPSPYDREVEAERQGRSADELPNDDDTPLEEAYRPQV
jgi:hypothetical protein